FHVGGAHPHPSRSLVGVFERDLPLLETMDRVHRIFFGHAADDPLSWARRSVVQARLRRPVVGFVLRPAHCGLWLCLEARDRPRQSDVVAIRKALMAAEVLFRCDASPVLGAGHVVRCLAFAETLSWAGWSCRFAVAPGTSASVPALGLSGVA